jgi:hypothetical protein
MRIIYFATYTSITKTNNAKYVQANYYINGRCFFFFFFFFYPILTIWILNVDIYIYINKYTRTTDKLRVK